MQLPFLIPLEEGTSKRVRFIGPPTTLFIEQIARGRFYYKIMDVNMPAQMIAAALGAPPTSIMCLVNHVIDRADGKLKLLFVDPIEVEAGVKYVERKMARDKGSKDTPSSEIAPDFKLTASRWWKESEPNNQVKSYPLYKASRPLIWKSEELASNALTAEEKELYKNNRIEYVVEFMKERSMYQEDFS